MTKRRHRRLPRKLVGYAAAAGASLAAHEGIAGIRYTDFDPKGVDVSSGFGLDLDSDGDAEFVFRTRVERQETCQTTGSHTCTIRAQHILYLDANGANAILASYGNARPVATGFMIATSEPAEPSPTIWSERTCFAHNDFAARMECGGYTGFDPQFGGPFVDTRGFLAFAFDRPAGRHAGWADLAMIIDETLEAYTVLHGYGYETEPGQPIAAGAVPEPPSLVLLAAGAAGLATLRKRWRTLP